MKNIVISMLFVILHLNYFTEGHTRNMCSLPSKRKVFVTLPPQKKRQHIKVRTGKIKPPKVYLLPEHSGNEESESVSIHCPSHDPHKIYVKPGKALKPKITFDFTEKCSRNSYASSSRELSYTLESDSSSRYDNSHYYSSSTYSSIDTTRPRSKKKSCYNLKTDKHRTYIESEEEKECSCSSESVKESTDDSDTKSKSNNKSSSNYSKSDKSYTKCESTSTESDTSESISSSSSQKKSSSSCFSGKSQSHSHESSSSKSYKTLYVTEDHSDSTSLDDILVVPKYSSETDHYAYHSPDENRQYFYQGHKYHGHKLHHRSHHVQKSD